MSESSSFPPRLLRTRLYEQVAGQISSWIDDNGLRAGDKLPPERELAQRLGVSRATLSQALVALEVVGVVEVRHGDGTVVTARHQKSSRSVEGDERFHGAVTAASHSLLLARLMDEIGDLIKETRLESLGQPGRPQDSLAGHRAIAEAIRAGDPV